ncbi:MAG: hypothetical protein CMN44_10375 [SAR116 cluster bacterium]|nr:hypothetical protein [SAR116 cluster bacterium]RPH07765.1 MAG: HAD family hydrolase [Alphaproteobacteria bacterium TMED54]|tara:strand:- start:5 stop:670 length:666 start_codon:yes stop_codon:yes gene_type:complete
MSKKTSNKIIIFDLDGTLIHSLPDMSIAMNKTLKHFKLRTLSEEKLQEFVGEGMLKLSENVLKFSGADLDLIDNFFSMYRKEYSENPYNLTTLMPGVKDSLKYLLNKNVRINICTNKRQHVAEKILKLMNLSDNFDFIVGAKENVPLKPHRQMIDFICNQYNSNENEFIMVGDTNVDIMAAKNAGISSIIVDGGYTNKDYKSLGADICLNNMSELKSVLNL